MNDRGGRQAHRVRAMSLAQQRLWFVDQLRPGSAEYLLPMAVKLAGDLNEAALMRAISDIFDRHEILRTRYAVIDGEPVQCISDYARPRIVRRSLATGEDATALMAKELRRPFDLTRDLPLRTTIARLAADERLLLIVAHHIAFDGMSWNPFTRELGAGYTVHVGGDADMPAAPELQYAEFAAWQREALTGLRLARHLDYWRGQLASLAPLALPTDKPRPPMWDSSGGVVRFDLPAELSAKADQFARAHRGTQFMVLLTVLQVLLSRYTGQTDLAVGTPVAGRTRRGTEHLIGLFVNNVVLRTDLSGRPSFAELLGRVRGSSLAGFSHADAPFERVVEAVSPAHDLSMHPLYQVAFSLRSTPSEPLVLPGLAVTMLRPPLTGSPFDLAFDINTWADGSMTARLQYPTALFDRATVARFADAYLAVLREALAAPDRPVHEIELPAIASIQASSPAGCRAADAAGPSSKLDARGARWCDRLSRIAPLELPTDRPYPHERDPRAGSVTIEVPSASGSAISELAGRHNSTVFTVLLAAFCALLRRYTGQDDITVVTPAPGDGGAAAGAANMLMILGDLRRRPSFSTLIRRLSASVAETFAHADVPFEALAERLTPERASSRRPLVSVLFALRPANSTAAPRWPADGSGPQQRASAGFGLALSVRQLSDASLTCDFGYATALYDRATVEHLASHYWRLLMAALADPGRPLDELEILEPDERARLASGWDETATPQPAACLPDLIAAQAARTPQATAVIYEDMKLSYAALLDRADRLARRLRELGVRAETPVAVLLRRDTDLVVALLAVLRAGGAYVPIDPDQPLARRAYVLRDSGACVVVSRSWIRSQLPGPELELLLLDEDTADDSGTGGAMPLPTPDPANAAYVVYTSGSTGRPKGVVISHEAIRNRVLWTVREHGLGPADRVLQKTTVGFDAAMWEFLAPLISGGTVVVAADGVARDTAAMAQSVATHRITVLQLVPSVLRMLVAEPGLRDCITLRLVFCAGEPLPASLCDRLHGQLDVQIINTYGPTECAIDVTAWPYSGDEPNEIVAIGRPIDNISVLVLDPTGALVPIGVAGELCVAGVQLARGYAGRGDLTAERFVPHPFPRVPGERIYRTGDRVRRRADGVLEFLGRLDRQVKLRGMRIEPGEIEAALCEQPGVTAAAAGVYETADGDQRLVAHIVAGPGATPDPEKLRTRLADQLPAAMVPSVLRILPALPVTASGKTDRAALPGLTGLTVIPAADDEYVPPSGAVQASIAASFTAVLGVPRVGANDDFFALGGHSLLATLLVFRLRAAFGVVVPVAEIFTRRTVARLAELLAAPGALTDDDKAPISPVPRTETMLPSSAQQRMWFLDRLEPGSVEYLVPVVLRIEGELDVPALTGALDDLMARHEVLRTRYVGRDGMPLQVIDPPAPLGVTPVDLTGMPRRCAAERASDLLRDAMSRPFALDAEWPLRALLVHVGAGEFLFALTMHHIAIDAWSTDVLTRDLRKLYHARTAAAPAPPQLPLPVQYADFAAWQDRWSRGPRIAASLTYWRNRLADLTPTELPADRPRPSVRDPRGDLLPFSLPTELSEAVTDLAARHAVTPFVVLFAVFSAMLSRYTGQTDITVGTPVAGRTRPEIEDVAGLFSNTVVLRVSLAGNPAFVDLLDRANDCVVSAYGHQDLPFERLVDELRPERDLSRNPLFQIMFEYRHAPGPAPRLDGVTAERVPAPWHTAKFDLTLSLARHADGSMHGLIEYATALYDRVTVDRLAGHYLHLLSEATARPHTPLNLLPMLTDTERQQVLRTWNPAGPDAERGPSVPTLFEQRAARHPGAPAVVSGQRTLTYAELNVRANQLAWHLREMGARPGTAVAVCMERGPESVTALLAVLKAGAMYVPVDPAHPASRLSFMLADAEAAVVVTAGRFASLLADAGIPLVLLDRDGARIASRPSHNLASLPEPDDLAYMIYTSGSTGQPKGVLIEHRAYAHHCLVIASEYGLRPGERVVLLSALTFDVSMDQIAATLLAGATVVVAGPQFWSPAELPGRIASDGITIMEITPAYYREVMRDVVPGDPRLLGLRLMNVGSDVVTAADERCWTATGLPGRFLCNYGPTEATVTCMLHRPDELDAGARDEAALPIGRPVPGTRAYVLDRHGDPVPVGVPGELHLAGIRLARGYHRRAALTAEKFVPDPFGDEPGGRLYRTGDLARYRVDGVIEFLGRIDGQVKLRGLRIELGEIEAVLAGHPGVRAAVVAARDLRPGCRGIVAYVVPDGDAVPAPTALRAYLADRLPGYMCPSAWVTLPELPLTPSRKVDRGALPAPGRPASDRVYVPPRTPTEEVIAGVWAEALGLDRIGADDDVFMLGAHSLLASRVLTRLDTIFGTSLPLRTLFEATTIAALGTAVQAAIEDEISGMTDDEVASMLTAAAVDRAADAGSHPKEEG